MRIFLIDTENIGTAGINCLNELDSSDLIVAFTNKYFSNSNTTVKFAFELKEAAVQFKYLVLNTRNINQYLDRVLGTVLGQLLAQYSEATAVIISNDKGYLPEIEYWRSQKRNVICCSSIEYFLHPERKPTAITIFSQKVHGFNRWDEWLNAATLYLFPHFLRYNISNRKEKYYVYRPFET